MMYASCPAYYDEIGRGHLTADQEKEILDKLPAFDPLTARSQRDNGVLVEFLRTYPGSLVNHHVARFVVWGKHAEYLISEQPWHYPFGFGSPLDRFLKLEGKILLLGSDHDNVTFLHYAEHVVNIPENASRDIVSPWMRTAYACGRTWRNSILRTWARTLTGLTDSLRILLTLFLRPSRTGAGASGTPGATCYQRANC